MSDKSAQRQFLVKVHGIDGYWMTKTGGDITASTSKIYDGGELNPDVLAGPAEASNVTVTRGYAYDRDAVMIKTLKKQVGSATLDITVTPLARDMSALASQSDYPKALLVGLIEPEPDAQSGDPGIVSLEFAISNFS